MTEKEQSDEGWAYDCRACGAYLESRPGETFAEFSSRVFDEHTIKHIKARDAPPRSFSAALSDLLDLIDEGVLS